MNNQLIQKLQYSYPGQNEAYQLPVPLKESLYLISDFFSNKNTTNKLCLVFPSKEYAAQWLSVPLALDLIKFDYLQYSDSIYNAYKKYTKGDRLIFNNDAIVEWLRAESDLIYFKHLPFRDGDQNGDEIGVSLKYISKLQPAPNNRHSLSSYKRVKKAMFSRSLSPIDSLLEINTDGNKLFQKNCLCLISKLKSYYDSIEKILLNHTLMPEYFKAGKIDDNGNTDEASPLLISNNLSNLALYLTRPHTVAKIIIDGYSAIYERGTDFSGIDVFKIPTILITDLSEIETFENIGNYGFEFFNFTKENLGPDNPSNHSPFYALDNKLQNYISFNVIKEICENTKLESTTQLIHSIEKDDSVKELVTLKILFIQLTNFVSRIVHPLSQSEVVRYKNMLSKIKSYFFENKSYLGGSVKAIEGSISLLKTVIEKFEITPSEKCTRLTELIKANQYDYIICTTEDEALPLSLHLNTLRLAHKPNVISVADVNNSILDSEPVKAILTGWAKTNNVNRLLSSFLFSELTVLFYQFESRYFNSLQNRNKRFISNVKSTINKKGIRADVETETEKGFADLYKIESTEETNSNFDIAEFELKLDYAQFSKYIVRGNLADSVKAKRVEFKNDKFIYLTDTHGLLVLENFHQSTSKSLYIHKGRIENLHHGDLIAFLKTERELLNKIVGRQTTPAALTETTKWIELWKRLIRNHYKLLNNDFNKLVSQLKDRGCNRDPVTIRSWLFDDLRIGPRKDDDLISIAIMTDGTELYNNIQQVRNAIRQMTSWRMKASDFLIEQLKAKIKSTHSTIQVNSVIDFEDLGEVEILEITEINNSHDNIDIKNVNRLLEKAKL